MENNKNNSLPIIWTTLSEVQLKKQNTHVVGCSHRILNNFIFSISLFLILLSNVAFSQCTVTGSADVCIGDIKVYQTSFSGSTYHWTVIGGSVMSFQNGKVTVIWGPAGTGTVSVQINDANQSVLATCSLGVFIHSLPQPNITTSFITECVLFEKDDHGNITPNIDPSACWKVCESSTVQYFTPLNTGSTYVWEVIGAISVTQTPAGNEISVQWDGTSNALVRVTETNQFGCSSTVEQCITVMRKPITTLETVPAFVIQPGGNKELTVCLYETITFNGFFNPGNSNSPVMNWFWNFGDGQVSTEQNPNHSYSRPGTYEVQLIVTNQCGCQAIANLVVYVTESIPPTIECATPVCQGDTATYFTYAQCDNYVWTVTNGTIISPTPLGSSIQVVWNNGVNGPGVVTLETPGCEGYCSIPTSIEIPILFAGYQINGPGDVCVNEQVKYSVPLVPATVYIWDVPGASLIIGQGTNEILVEWNNPGSSLIRVDYRNDFLGCEGFDLIPVTIKNTFSITAQPAEICDHGSVTFSTTPSAIFNWNIRNATTNALLQVFGAINGNLVISNWSHGPGTFKITAGGSATYCSAQSILFTVLESPPAPRLPSGDSHVCGGTPHVYKVSPSSPGYFIKWHITHGSPVTMEGNEVTVTWDNTGPYSLYVTQIDMLTGCESPPSPISHITKIGSVPPIVPVADPQCVNTIVTYSITNGAFLYADEIQWEIIPATAGSVIQTLNGGTQATVQWNADPAIDVELIVKTKTCGTIALSTTFVLDLVAVPEIEIQASPNPVCDGSEITFTVANLPAGSYTYNWTFPTGTASGSSPSIFVDRANGNTQDVSVVVTDANQCASTDNIKVYVNPNPGANIVKDGFNCPNYTLTALQTGSNYLIYWSTGATSPSINISSEGFYLLDVQDITTGCWSQDFVEIDCDVTPPIDICLTDPSISFTITPVSCNEISLSISNLPGAYSNYLWNFGDGTGGSSSISSHVYSLPGIYTVCLTGEQSGGGCASSCQTIDLSMFPDFDYGFECLQTPVAILSSNPVCTAYYALKVFDKSIYDSNGLPVSWTWSNGTTTLATGQHPASIPLCSGSQNITLTISNANSSCSKVLNIVVPDPPVPSFSVSTNPVCEDFTPVQFTYTGTDIANILSASWYFDDGAYSSLFPLIGPQTERVYDGAGFFYPTLSVTDLYGCSYTSTQTTQIEVHGNDLNATYNPNTTISFCPGGGQLIQLQQISPSNPNAYLWSNGATTSSIWVNQTGAYTVTMINSLTGCELKLLPPAQVAVHNMPFPVISGDLQYCEGETVDLIAFQGSGYNYLWTATKNGLPFTGFSNPTVGTFEMVSALPGTYIINLSLSSSSSPCTTSNAVTVVVNEIPDVPIISSSVNPACEGDLVELSVSNPGTNYVNWSNGASGPIIQVYNAGIYRATFTNESGCTSYADYIVNPEPDFSFIISGCFDYCTTDEITIPGDDFHAYQYWEWQVTSSGGLYTQGGSGSVGPLHLANLDPGFYSIQLYAINDFGCESLSDPIYLSIKSCQCEYFINEPELKFYCMFESASNLIYYHVTIVLPQDVIDHCNDQNTALVITSPDGTFTPTIGFPNNPMEGIFVPYTPGLENACFEFNLENPLIDFKNCNCLYIKCDKLPKPEDCRWPGECDMDVHLDQVICSRGGSPNHYEFDLSIFAYSDYTVWFSVPNGTLTGMPLTLTTGANQIHGHFIFNPPPYDFCIDINAYDSTTQKFCKEKVCYEDGLPDCIPNRMGSDYKNTAVMTDVVAKTSLKLAPNPAISNLSIFYGLSSNFGVLKVIDARGKVMFYQRLVQQTGLTEISTSAFIPGVYWVRIESDSGENAGTRLMIMK